MNPIESIEAYIASQPASKSDDLRELHRNVLRLMPKAKLWFLDGRDAQGKVVTNPNIGYGEFTIHTADGKSRDFYRIGLSANTAGISVYIMGLDDKKYLEQTYGASIGKAKLTGYCIKFKALKDIKAEVLYAAIKHGASLGSGA